MRNGRRATSPFGENGVAVAHQHDRLLVGARVVEADVDRVAKALVRFACRDEAVLGKNSMKRSPTASTPALS